MKFIKSGGLVALVIPAICGIIGFFLLQMASSQVGGYLSSRGWEEAEGTVIISELQTQEQGDSEVYRALVVYEYSVGRRPFEGNQFAFGSETYVPYREDVEAVIDQYTIGDSVTVFYNPNDPSESVLSRDIFPAAWGFFIIGFVLVAAAVLFAINAALGFKPDADNDTSEGKQAKST